MATQPKYTIVGKYLNEDLEEIDTADTKREAEYLVQEYRLAFGPSWRIYARVEKR